jgi:hypothetical protein
MKRQPFFQLIFRTYREPSLVFEASTDPIPTSEKAALAPQQTTEQKQSADGNSHGNVTCPSVHIELFN